MRLKAEKREIFGKKLSQSRQAGKLPAVLYGAKKQSTPIFVNFSDFKKVWKEAGESTLIDLDVGGKLIPALIYDVDLNPVNNEPRHADFYVVDMAQKITASVPLIFGGEASAVKVGGTLVKVMHEIEVEALPKDLPREIKVDVSRLKTFDDKITIADLILPEGVKVLDELTEVVALAEEAKEEQETEKSAEINFEEIKVESGKGKKEEEKEEEGAKKE